MPTRFILAVFVLLACNGSLADTIRFKNGTYIQVDKTQENGSQLDYWMGSTKYSTPKSEVEKIEKDTRPSISLGSQSGVNIVAPAAASQTFSVSGSVVQRTPVASKIAVPAQETPHFNLRYEGAQTPLSLEQALLSTLDEQFGQLAQALKYSPKENIDVILYTEQDFFDIAQSPSWAGGLNDGKLRIPLQGVTTMTPALEHVLKHELARSFIRSMVPNRVPAWLSEGLAQMLEPRSSSPYALMLARLFQQKKEIPFAALEQPFNGAQPMQAEFAYAESLTLVQFLNARYGMDGVLRILHRVGEGEAPEAALRGVTQSGYTDLERQVADYLAKGGAR